MHRHGHRPARAATWRPLTRRLLVAVAQAAQPDQPHAASLAGGLAGAVQSADHGPTHDMLDGAVVSSGAPDQRLDVSAALDHGRRLFSLEARYQAGDYDLVPRVIHIDG